MICGKAIKLQRIDTNKRQIRHHFSAALDYVRWPCHFKYYRILYCVSGVAFDFKNRQLVHPTSRFAQAQPPQHLACTPASRQICCSKYRAGKTLIPPMLPSAPQLHHATASKIAPLLKPNTSMVYFFLCVIKN